MRAQAGRARLHTVASRRWWTARPDRTPLAVVVVLASTGAVFAMGTGSSPSDGVALGISPTLSVLEAPGRSADGRRHRGVAGHYERIVRKRVPPPTAAEFLPLHRAAGRRFGVNWRLLASIHRQETAFSTASSTYHGLNAFGCCAGPMQFNVTNGPVSTWKLYRNAFRGARRPHRYPHRTRHHPSVYDDFDAITAAASLLRDSGAGGALDANAWWAAYSYYGHDLFGVTYANEVLARAVAWQRDGFCANCALDAGLVARFERAYGRAVRRDLRAGERREKQRKQRKKAREEKRRQREKRRRREERRQREERERRAQRGGDGSKRRDARRKPARERPSKPPRTQSTVPVQPPTAVPPPAPAAEVPPAAAPPPCSSVRRLLGQCPPR